MDRRLLPGNDHPFFIHNEFSARTEKHGAGDPFHDPDLKFVRQDPDDLRLFYTGDRFDLFAECEIIDIEYIVSGGNAGTVTEEFLFPFPIGAVDDFHATQFEMGVPAEKSFAHQEKKENKK